MSDDASARLCPKKNAPSESAEGVRAIIQKYLNPFDRIDLGGINWEVASIEF